MGEWRQYNLADVGRIVTGKTPPTSNPDFYGGEIPFVTPTDMDGRRTIDHTVRCLSEIGAEKVRSSYIHERAIVVSCIGSDMGKAALVSRPFVSNQQINSVVVSTKFDRLFVYYNLSARKAEIRDKASGAAQPIMNKTDFGSLVLRAPNLGLQQAISGVLDALDDKIELNRRMNETLEAMARAIFKDWFVDFGPTRAKAEGRAPYLAPELWDLFPDALDNEGKPVGWVTQPVNHLFEFNPRETLKIGTCAPYLDMAALPTSGLTPRPPSARKFKSGSKYRDGDALFARITPCLENGKTAFVFGLGDAVIGAGSTEFIVIRSKKPLPQAASYLLARDPEFRAHAKRSMTGTSGRQRVNVAVAGNYEMTTPQAEGPWKALAALVEPRVDGVIANAQGSRTLSETRDLLLPKLISGELRLRDAEKVIEAMA